MLRLSLISSYSAFAVADGARALARFNAAFDLNGEAA